MEDKIIKMFFEPERWKAGVSHGLDKDIRKDQLYQLTKPETRAAIYQQMKEGKYQISPPHTALIPKDKPGEYRTVYVNEPIDRVILSIANDLLFELMPEMIHPKCRSYQKGVGCGQIVKEVSNKICETKGEIIGWKSDLSKYFDSVPLKYIDMIFDAVEDKHGKSALIDVIRGYYHSDWYFDTNNELQSGFQSLKQGCAVAAFLADAILYHIDKRMDEEFVGYYVRYSDDMLYIGHDYLAAMNCLTSELEAMQMKLNPKKVEYLSRDRWFKFLGFSIKGDRLSLSQTRIKTFQKEIEKRTVKNRKTTFKRAITAVNNYLYKGNGEFSWATQILPICNVKEDVDILNMFVMDALRAVSTGKRKIGGLGYMAEKKVGCIARGTGRNVKANREKTEKNIEGYLTLGCMQKALVTRKALYNTLVSSL